MPQAIRFARSSAIASILILAGPWIGPGQARADRITLRGGGQVKGKLVPDQAHPGRFLLIGEVGKTPMSFGKDQIAQVTPETGPLDDYLPLRAKERATAEADYELGVWCEEHKLPDLALVHFEQAVKRDSTFGPAHEKLGHVERDGRWLNADELRAAQGLVKYKGRWVTPEEKGRKEAQAATVVEGAGWLKRIKAWRDGYVDGPEGRSREAERRLLEIREVIAVGPVVRVLGNDPLPPVRTLAAKVLGAIPGPEAASALAGRLLAETEETVRVALMAEIARREPADVVPTLTRALRAPAAEVVNRAAWGLANLNVVAAVPKLVPALITVETRMEMTPGTGGGGGGNGSIGASFNAVPPAPGGGGYGIYSGGSLPILTPPAVGPGVVAFGATSVPYGALNSSGVNLGGGSRGPVPRMVTVEHRNVEVLAALVKLTGRDFGFDIPTWRRWVATSFRVEPATPSRRVPQP